MTGWSEPRDLFPGSRILCILLILSIFLLCIRIRGKELGQDEQDDLQTYDVSTYSDGAMLTSIGMTTLSANPGGSAGRFCCLYESPARVQNRDPISKIFVS